jgi:hypothetical protein
MAQYNCSSRTNYFRVKDEAAFVAFADKWNCEVIRDSEGRFGLLPGEWTDDGSFPSYDSEKDEDFHFQEKLAPHLADGEIGVIIEAGAEKLCYISGHATAFNNKGEEIYVALHQIYDIAKKHFGIEPTSASY